MSRTNYGIFLKRHLYSFLLSHLHCNPFTIACRMMSIKIISIQITKPPCRERYEWNSNTRKPKLCANVLMFMPGAAKLFSYSPCNVRSTTLQIWPVAEIQKERKAYKRLWVSNMRSECLHTKSKDRTFQKVIPYLYNCLVFPDTFILLILPWKPAHTCSLQSAEAASSSPSSSTNNTQRALSFRCVLSSLQSPACYLSITVLFWISLSHWSILLWLLPLLFFKHKSEHWSGIH